MVLTNRQYTKSTDVFCFGAHQHFSEILINRCRFSLKLIYLKMSSAVSVILFQPRYIHIAMDKCVSFHYQHYNQAFSVPLPISCTHFLGMGYFCPQPFSNNGSDFLPWPYAFSTKGDLQRCFGTWDWIEVFIGLNNCLACIQHQAIIFTSCNLLLIIDPCGTW